jgi:hypothetical protein
MSRFRGAAWGSAFVLSLLACEYGCGGTPDNAFDAGPFGSGSTNGSGSAIGNSSTGGGTSGNGSASGDVATSGTASTGGGGSTGSGASTSGGSGGSGQGSSGTVASSGTSAGTGTPQGGADAGAIDSGTVGAGGGFPAGTPFKGVAFAEAQGANCSDLAKLNLSWFYNWSGSTACKGGPPFVPQVWGNWNKISWVASPQKIAAAGFNIVLGFNEPDNGTQSNMTVAQAIQLWPQMTLPAFQRVGSPATSSSPGGQTWTQQFMAAAKQQSLRVDFVAIHWYGWTPGSCANVKGLDAYITWAEQWGKPVWITEFSCRLQSAAVTKAFYDAALVMFKNHALLERYAWFETRSTGEFAGATLIDPAGNLTPLGQDYAAAPAVH